MSDKALDRDVEQAMDTYLDAEDDAREDAEAWLDGLGTTLDEVAPYIRLANEAVARGEIAEDSALDVASAAFQKAKTAEDVAEREAKYSKWGDMDSAIDDVWSRSEGDGPKAYVPTPSKTAKGFAKGVDSATDRLLSKLTNRQNTLEAARLKAQRAR